jgi:transcriptional regulator with XRE-family HTH domain
MTKPVFSVESSESHMAETPRTPKVAVIAEHLTAIRKQKGVTQIEMAKKLKVTQSMYSRYERGDARIYADLLCKMASILDSTPNELCGITKSGNDATEPIQHQIPKRFIRRLRGVEDLTRTEQDSLLLVIDRWLESGTRKGTRKKTTATVQSA